VGKDKYLEFEKFPIVGIVKTYSADSLVTDSAAAATAMACGVKTNNGYLGLDANKSFVETVLELAKKKGKSTGLVTNVTITHATPAGFAAHMDSRSELPIAEQYAELKNVDVLLGGGLELFLPKSVEGSKRKDERNLIEEFRSSGYVIVTNREELFRVDVLKTNKLLGLFKDIETTYVIDKTHKNRQDLPSLAEMCEIALKVLSKNPKGFFLMIEGGKIDWACHSNDITTAVYEMEEFNAAVKTVVEKVSKLEDTLIIVTADHETGGLSLSNGEYRFYPEKIWGQKISVAQISKLLKNSSKEEIRTKFAEYTGIKDLTEEEVDKISVGDVLTIGRIISLRIEVGWSTKSHSGCSVPLYAKGKNAEVFSGVYENTEIAKKIIKIMNLK
ncbi:MAG: alkaline phosphatase, partial [Endomicrobia bacterium]|nr:alkaline phosphatase [Endomicrobiia bacterium]